MKVTVNFGSVRVIVPCGKGDLPVKKLMDLAITRYKKATGKSADSWVTIHNLKLLSDGGILDPDDKLNDVADDREQITAVYDEELSSYLIHNGGDGTSASSIGTESPDIFQNVDILSAPLNKPSFVGSDADIKEEKIIGGLLPLHVRRGSEPALNRLSPSLLSNVENCKRWSAAVLANEDCFNHLNSEGEELSEDEIPPGEREDGSGEEKSVSYQQYLNSWNNELNFNQDERKEPLGGPITSPKHSSDEADDSDSSSNSIPKIEIIRLQKEDGPLGIRIAPASINSEKNHGVIIQGIEPGGRIDRDGRFSVGDHITEINGFKISRDSYRNAQEILKDALKAPELKIHCIKKDSTPSKNRKNKLPAILPKPNIPLENEDIKCDNVVSENNKVLPFSTPTKKLFANVLHKGTPVHSSIRKIGRRILVHLTKGPEGLGFSITSKDPDHGPPFFIKNILPAGAAVDDGRLKTGDKLLEVNKVDVSNLTQPEVLNMLRNIPFGDVVELVISRLETDLSPSPSLPRQLPIEKAEEEIDIVSSKRRDIFTYKIALNDTGSAGLGVSVKGKTSNTEKGPMDMGIFLKNIFHGGAAHKDGRLQNNDQLMNVNGISLLGMTNGQAMETLRRAMIQAEGPNVVPNAIILTVARRFSHTTRDNPSDQGDSSGHDRSDSLLSESGDSFYVSNENLSTNIKCNGITPDTSTSDNSGNTVIFMLPAHSSTSLSNEECNITELASEISNSKICASVIELTNVDSQQCQSQKSKDSADNNSKLVDLIDLNDTVTFDSRETSCALSEDFENSMSIVNHQKSFSNPVDMDVYAPALNGHETLSDLRHCSSPTPVNRGVAKRKRFIMERNDNFKRSGMGRQSMPERMLWSYQQQQYSRDDSISPKDCYKTPPNVHVPHQKNVYCDNMPVREMPVDVGPYEASLNVQENEQISKGSCNSPDCPYHAVPTTGRESGTSDEMAMPVGPALGLFKSSSLESLQTMLHEQHKQMSGGMTNGNSSRGCNESFRAAVDKSFEVAEQNKKSGTETSTDQPTGTNRHVRSKTVETMEKKESKSHKKKGIFRGLGSVFRFGKSKKSNKESVNTSCKTPVISDLVSDGQAEQERLNRLHQQQLERQNACCQNSNQNVNRMSRNSFTFPRNRNAPSFQSQKCTSNSSQTRIDRMYALRNEHQKKHQQRNGYYPHEDKEEVYERQIKQTMEKPMLNRPLPPLPHQLRVPEDKLKRNAFELSPKGKNLEVYKEMSKPGSRKGFVDPDRYSHYMNFQEIQQHLQQFRHHQNLFFNDYATEIQNAYFLSNSQVTSPNKRYYRHTVSSPRSRPVSEFFDFKNPEMLNSALKGTSESGSLPRKMFQNGRQRPPIPLTFMMQQNGNVSNRHVPANLYGQTSGLEEMYKYKSSGSKV